MDYSGLVKLPVVGAFGPRKHSNKLSGSTNVEKFLHQPREYQLLNTTYAQSLDYNRGPRTF
jgi:hypothetical protein